MSDVYLRVTDKEGKTSISSHQTWDAELFIERTRERYEKEGGSVEVISQDAYRDEKWPGWREKKRANTKAKT